jgi:hypothetical protein
MLRHAWVRVCVRNIHAAATLYGQSSHCISTHPINQHRYVQHVACPTVHLPGHPCRRCFGKSQQRVLYQWTTWLRPLSRGKQGGSQLNIRCSSPLQPDAFGLLQTAVVTDSSRSLRVSMMALVRDHVNMMWRICRTVPVERQHMAIQGQYDSDWSAIVVHPHPPFIQAVPNC